MSKAEEAAYKAYPYNGDYRGQGDSNSKIREVLIEGYHQAEKDLELTWEDIKMIDDCLVATIDPKSPKRSKEEFYQEVLKRFKELKDK